MFATPPRSMCGVVSFWTELLNPSFTSAVYLDMLENFVFPQTVTEDDSPIFQQDGVPTALNEQFPCWWIGRKGPINWPPWSPGLAPMDLFFWGYSKWVGFLSDLHHRITVAITVVPVYVLSWAWSELEFCFNACRAFNGAHVGLH
jgi:hypothetical protein